jgi:Synergist-CTERM protein sorting domain-containing protein
MNKPKKLSVVFILAALLTAATSACAFASMSLPRSANDCLDSAFYKLDLAPLSSDNTTELYVSNTELWSYDNIRSEIGQNALDQIDNWDATLVGVWGPFEKTTGYDEAVRRIKLDASQATIDKITDWGRNRMYLYFFTTDSSGNDINVVAKGWFNDFLVTGGSDYDYFDVSNAIKLSDWNTQNLYVFMVRDDRDNSWDDDFGGGSGCNAGFGAFALLAVIPLILRKKK